MENNRVKSKITDNSGDKKYFAIIPYYIVDHSSAYEQSLYLVMKRIASEEGTCWASAITIGKIMKISPNTVRKYQGELLKKGWVRIVGRKGKTKPTNEFEIVDLWKLNMDYYSKKESSVGEQSFEENSTGEKIVQPVSLVSSTIGDKEKNIEEKILKKKEFSFNKIRDYKFGKRWGEIPYFRNQEMRWLERNGQWRWEVIPKEGGTWLEFAGKESEIEWK
jgi:hypothetical protein